MMRDRFAANKCEECHDLLLEATELAEQEVEHQREIS